MVAVGCIMKEREEERTQRRGEERRGKADFFVPLLEDLDFQFASH